MAQWTLYSRALNVGGPWQKHPKLLEGDSLEMAVKSYAGESIRFLRSESGKAYYEDSYGYYEVYVVPA
jgi:hypothetical protein